MSKQFDPIFKVEPTDPRNPKAVDVTLKFDTPKEVPPKEEGWNPSWRYSVKIDDKDYTIFATKGLHNAIQETGAKAGDTVSVVRFGEGLKTEWDVLHTDNLGTEAAKNHGDAGDPFERPAGGYRPKPDAKTEFYNSLKRYQEAWTIAGRFLEKNGGDASQHSAVAFTFYRMASDAGYDIREEEGNTPGKGLPAEATLGIS